MLSSALSRVARGQPLEDADALALADARGEQLDELMQAAAGARDRAFGKVATFSPKVFLPLTNLCRNRCDYCSFRRSPGDAGRVDHDATTRSRRGVARAREQGCVEALFCLGDKPESAFSRVPRATLAGHRPRRARSTTSSGPARAALERGLLPHTNAGVLDARRHGAAQAA